MSQTVHNTAVVEIVFDVGVWRSCRPVRNGRNVKGRHDWRAGGWVHSGGGSVMMRWPPHSNNHSGARQTHVSSTLNAESGASCVNNQRENQREKTQEMSLRRIQTPLSYNWQLYFKIRTLQCFRTKQSIRAKNKSQLNQYTVFEFNSSNVVAATAVAEGWWNPTWNKNTKSLHDNNNKINNRLLEIISFLQ